jgi:hypothetical protein
MLLQCLYTHFVLLLYDILERSNLWGLPSSSFHLICHENSHSVHTVDDFSDYIAPHYQLLHSRKGILYDFYSLTQNFFQFISCLFYQIKWFLVQFLLSKPAYLSIHFVPFSHFSTPYVLWLKFYIQLPLSYVPQAILILSLVQPTDMQKLWLYNPQYYVNFVWSWPNSNINVKL